MLKTGDLAINFKLPDDRGQNISLFDRIPNDAPLMLIFYKFSCPTCQYTFTFLPRIARDVGHEYFLAVAQDTPQEAQTFRRQYNFDFEIACDTKPYPVSKKYGLDFVPTIFIVEPDKRISNVAEGFDKTAIEEFAARIANKKKLSGYHAFSPTEQVPLLKPG